MEKSAERISFLWQIIRCSRIDLLIIAVRNFQQFSDRSFVDAFELSFTLKLHYTVESNFPNPQDHHSNRYFLTINATASMRVLEASE